MLPKLLALTGVLLLGIAAAVVGTSRAQESGSPMVISTLQDGRTATFGETTVTVPPTITVARVRADMPLKKFKELRVALRAKANKIKLAKCGTKVHPFRFTHRQIKPWNRDENLDYWRGRVQFWKKHAPCWSSLESGIFDVPLAKAAAVFGISYNWIHACSHSEGNYHGDRFIMNSQGSGAGGWMQFMESTFNAHVDNAFAVARKKGWSVPSVYKRWDSKIGQAVTASYMFYRGWSSAWTGAGC